jgi:glycosyltransferase involved in cell wall biosynthesis
MNTSMKSRRKVVMLAPVEPYRSGIAKHSTQVAASLAKRDDIDLIVMSFKRLYPSFLFPGESDKDTSEHCIDLGADFNVDTINPLSWRRAANNIIALRPELLIVPAWTFFVAPCIGWISRRCAEKGIKTACIVHNAFDHEQGGWKNRLMRYQLDKLDYFLCHNEAIAQDIKRVLPKSKIAISPHPIFDQYPAAKDMFPKRASIELLFFGIIREYKGLDILIDALNMLEYSDFKLTVVGECWGDINEYKQQADKLGLIDKIEFIAKYVTDQEAAEYFQRADVVILPYRSMTGTGVIPLAYHYGKPVITSNLDAFYEVVEHGETGFIAEDVSASGMSDSITEFFQVADKSQFELNIEQYRKKFTWSNFSIALLELASE